MRGSRYWNSGKPLARGEGGTDAGDGPMSDVESANTGESEPANFAEGLPPRGPKQTPAFCPQCNGAMGMMDRECPHCGFSFPPSMRRREPGFIYSRMADLALIVGSVASGLGCVGTVISAIGFLLNGNLGTALILCPLAFFIQLAMMVVFIRVQRITPP
jgi:hypothetical protein